MILYCVHGWGFGPEVWRPLMSQLTEFRFELADLGYFGSPSEKVPDEPFVAVTHSYGTMRVLSQWPVECRGMVAINGFACFAQSAVRGTNSTRVVDRMVRQFRREPAAVLRQFRQRCGTSTEFGPFEALRLERDLFELRDADYRKSGEEAGRTILSIQSREDPILPQVGGGTYFGPSCRTVTAVQADAGHLLPLSHPAFCADTVRQFAKELA